MLGLVCIRFSLSDVPATRSASLLIHSRMNRAMVQDDALPLGRDEETNRIDVGQSHFVQIQRRWSATRGNLRADMLDVFRAHAAD